MDADELIDELNDERKSRHIPYSLIAAKCGKCEKSIARFFQHALKYSDVMEFEKIANALGYELYLMPITRRKK